MGNYTGSVRFRSSAGNQDPAQLCEFGNEITNAMLAIGMLPVLESDFSGQAGTYVTGTPGSGETQITAAGTVNGVVTFGYNVFKHPTLDLYVQVYLRDRGSATSSRVASVSYTMWRQLSGGAGAGSGLSIYPLDAFWTGGSIPTANQPTTYTDLFASCGDEHFWIYNKPNHTIVTNNGSGVTTTNAGLPAGVSFTGVAVFAAAEDADRLLVVAPQLNASTSATNTFSGGSMSSNPEQASTRNYSSLTPSSGWVTQPPGACCTLTHPAAESVTGGVRVSRGQLVLDGVKHNFNFGWLNAGAASDASLIELDFTGLAQNYRVAHAFGAGNHAYYSMPLANMAAIVLPWDE